MSRWTIAMMAAAFLLMAVVKRTGLRAGTVKSSGATVLTNREYGML
jgi:hypothetical protein